MYRQTINDKKLTTISIKFYKFEQILELKQSTHDQKIWKNKNRMDICLTYKITHRSLETD